MTYNICTWNHRTIPSHETMNHPEEGFAPATGRLTPTPTLALTPTLILAVIGGPPQSRRAEQRRPLPEHVGWDISRVSASHRALSLSPHHCAYCPTEGCPLPLRRQNAGLLPKRAQCPPRGHHCTPHSTPSPQLPCPTPWPRVPPSFGRPRATKARVVAAARNRSRSPLMRCCCDPKSWRGAVSRLEPATPCRPSPEPHVQSASQQAR